ncbi:MAG: hypothetical protein Aurels2KO_58590 [Aureliella sp.]
MADVEKIQRVTKWTRETADWLVPYAEVTEEETTERARVILKHVAPTTHEGRAIYKMITNALKATEWFIQDPDNPERRIRLD